MVIVAIACARNLIAYIGRHGSFSNIIASIIQLMALVSYKKGVS